MKRSGVDKNPMRGAVQSKTGFAARSSGYWAHHRTSLVESYHRLLMTPVQTLLTSLVVAIALALPVTLLLAMDNIDRLGQRWDANPKISVYLSQRARQPAIEQLLATVQSYPEVADVQYLSPEQALADFQQFSGFGDALEGLEQNPLPPTLIVSPQNTRIDVDDLRLLAQRIAEQAIVDNVGLDMDWVRRLQEIMALGRQVVLGLALLLSIGVLLAIGNTIRLAIENRRDEILVTKLVGGTDGFVRRPFLYSGGWYGLFGGVLACLIVALGHAALEPSVARLAVLYQSEFSLSGLGPLSVVKLLAVSASLGWMGAWIAVGRHLSEIEPR